MRSFKFIHSIIVALASLALSACEDNVRLVSATSNPNGNSGGTGGGVTVVGSSTGGVVGSGGSSSSAAQTSARLASDGTRLCPIPLQGPPRGLACIHCTQPTARAQADLIVDILARSCLENVAINYLVDGTFSDNYSIIAEHVSALQTAGKRVFLFLYLMNGPGQRRGLGGFATDISPIEFRERIIGDDGLRKEYQQHVRRIAPLITAAQARGAIVSVIPMLEDNLTNDAFESVSALTTRALPSKSYVAVGRNACRGCFRGNQDSVPRGLFREVHTANATFSVHDGVIINDGEDYSSAEELALGTAESALTLELLRPARDRAAALNNVFILWSGRRQGIPPNSRRFISPDDRIYDIPTAWEIDEILDFLEEGL